MKLEITERQMAALRRRFGATLDVEAELRSASEWLENMHAGRPYKNVGRFLWNWCLRSEKWDGKGMRRRGYARLPELSAFCTACGRLRNAALAPNQGSEAVCGWCGHREMSGNRAGDHA